MPPEPSDLALEAQCRCFKLLADLFDPEKGRYSRGYSDAKVARECGLAENAVATIRERVFGSLLPDPAIETARQEIASLEQRWARYSHEIEGMIGEVKVRLTAIERGEAR